MKPGSSTHVVEAKLWAACILARTLTRNDPSLYTDFLTFIKNIEKNFWWELQNLLPLLVFGFRVFFGSGGHWPTSLWSKHLPFGHSRCPSKSFAWIHLMLIFFPIALNLKCGSKNIRINVLEIWEWLKETVSEAELKAQDSEKSRIF